MREFQYLTTVFLISLLSFEMFAQTNGVAFVESKLPEHPLVICLGDSITKHGYPQEMEKLLGIRVVNAGIGGNTSRQGLARLQKDVLSKKPQVVVFFFGTNDSRRDAPGHQVGLEEYTSNLSKMVERCQEIGAEIVIGTMPPIIPEPYFTRHPKSSYDDVGGFEKYIESYREAARKVGREKKIAVIDLNALLQKNSGWSTPDGVHPTEEGDKVLAKLMAEQVKPLLKTAR
jgi:lysophospholipase L1-like esterase